VAEALKVLAGRASCAVFLSDGALIGQNAVQEPNAPPVIAVPLGDADHYKDVMIRGVRFPQVAFRGRETTIEASIGSHGYEGATVPILLKDGGKLLTARNVRLNKDDAETAVSFPFAPGDVGTHNLSVSIQPQAGEAITENNTADFSLKVARDKIRILMVTGSPSLNYRYLRLALKNDPSIDLLSFVILRTPSNVINVPLNEQSLIPFPVDTLFSKELKEFDLLIFDNLPIHLYLNQKHLEGIRDFVRGGGAFAMIGGPDLSDNGSLASSALSDILPMDCEGIDYRRARQDGVRLTPAGAVHPLMRLSSDKEHNGRLWKEMAPLDGINLLKPKRSSTVLLETVGAPARPVLALVGFGKGRVLVLGTDYAWEWSAGMVAKGRDNWAYLQFVERMVRWLTKDPGLDPLSITLPEGPAEAGEEVIVKIGVPEEPSGPTGQPLFSVFGPDGVKTESLVKAGGSPGEFIGSFTPSRRGTYRMKVETLDSALVDALAVGKAMDRIDGVPRPGVLERLAAQTGGKVASDASGILKALDSYAAKKRKTFTEKREMPLWSSYYALASIIALLSGEWYLRRRWGLP
jgi:uncharacterized membrane protein